MKIKNQNYCLSLTKYFKTALILCGVFTSAVVAQEKTSVKTGEIRVHVMDNSDGEIKEVEKTFSLDEMELVKELLKEKGVDIDIEAIDEAYKISANNLNDKENKKVVINVTEEEEGEEQLEKRVQVFKYEFNNDENGRGITEEETKREVGMQEMLEKIKTAVGNEEHRKFVMKTININTGEDQPNEAMIFVKKTSSVQHRNKVVTNIEEKFDESSAIQELKLFPNPTNNFFNMNFISKRRQDFQLLITDPKGSIVFKKELKSFKGSFNEEIDLSAYSNGVYFFNLTSGEEKVTKKIIVQ